MTIWTFFSIIGIWGAMAFSFHIGREAGYKNGWADGLRRGKMIGREVKK